MKLNKNNFKTDVITGFIIALLLIGFISFLSYHQASFETSSNFLYYDFQSLFFINILYWGYRLFLVWMSSAFLVSFLKSKWNKDEMSLRKIIISGSISFLTSLLSYIGFLFIIIILATILPSL